MDGIKNLDFKIMNIAILGLGEAGSHFANDLANLGISVYGWDPNPKRPLDKSIQIAQSNLDAAENADIIFSVNLTSASELVAREVKPILNRNKIYVELNTSSPDKKKAIFQILEESSVQFVDLAIMAPVPPKGILTPMLAAGPGANTLVEQLKPYGLAIKSIAGEVGYAAELKLLRSIVYKGIAAVICEAIDAGKLFNQEKYIREQISSIIGGNEDLIDRFVEGSQTHAERRIHEMDAVVEMLINKGLNPVMSDAAKQNLQKLLATK